MAVVTGEEGELEWPCAPSPVAALRSRNDVPSGVGKGRAWAPGSVAPGSVALGINTDVDEYHASCQGVERAVLSSTLGAGFICKGVSLFEY